MDLVSPSGLGWACLVWDWAYGYGQPGRMLGTRIRAQPSPLIQGWICVRCVQEANLGVLG